MMVERLAALVALVAACGFDRGEFDDRRCVLPTDCLPEEQCNDGLCVLRSCTIATDCGQGASCGYQFVCENSACVRQTCSSDAECTLPFGCSGGFCASVCAAFGSPTGAQKEGVGAYNAIVAVSPVSDRDVTLMVSTANGTAIAGTDFAVATTHTIPAGASSIMVPVTLLDNLFLEPDKSFMLNLTSVVPGMLGSPATQQVTIENDDTLPGVLFDPNETDGMVAEGNGVGGGANYDYKIVFSAPPETDVTVELDVTASTATLGGGANSDGTIVTIFPLTILKGTPSATITVRVSVDNDKEADETIVMKLVNATGAVASDKPRIHTILNDD
jgi:hypothetical protein